MITTGARLVALAFLIEALLAVGCHQSAEKSLDDAVVLRAKETKGTRSMEPKIDRQCDFSQVEKLFASYPCTPVLGREHENVIRINAPEEVLFTVVHDRPLDERMANFLVCGAMRMRAETLHELGIRDALDALMLVAVDTKSHKSYAGPVPQMGTSMPMPEALRTNSPPMLGYVFGESFNPNLVSSFELPAVETDYDVHVVLGPFKSNVLRVRLRRKK
jgi:hypothetical protein